MPQEEQGIDINSKDVLGQTPLHYAAMGSSEESVLELLSQGADVNMGDDLGEVGLCVRKTLIASFCPS